MNNRETENSFYDEITTIKCAHCSGSGKCNCFTCYCANIAKLHRYTTDYKDLMKEQPNILFHCAKCNGFGFVLIRKDGTIIVPKGN